MKMKVFTGEWYEAMDAFNNWAKGKLLNRDVLIQTHDGYVLTGAGYKHFLTIIVIHPEDPFWDKTQADTKQYPQITITKNTKPEEIKVTQ